MLYIHAEMKYGSVRSWKQVIWDMRWSVWLISKILSNLRFMYRRITIALVRVTYSTVHGYCTIRWYRTVHYRTVPYGTRYFVYEYVFTIFQRWYTPVDRGCRPLLVAYHRCPHLQTTRLVTNLPAPTILFYLFQLVTFYFLSRSILISLPP